MVSEELLELLDDFLAECDERVARVEATLLTVETAPAEERTEMLAALRRELHTLKGNAGMMGLSDLQRLAHSMEDAVDTLAVDESQVEGLLAALDEFKSGIDALRPSGAPAATPQAEPHHDVTVRIPTSDLDEVLDLATELLTARHRLAEAVAAGVATAKRGTEVEDDDLGAWKRLEDERLRIEKTLGALDERLRRLRMVPLKTIFSRLQRVVRDEAGRGGKLVKLVTRGEDTPLDAALVELAAETLGHLVRNAVVHGIETPSERDAASKPQQGTVLVEAALRARRVEIEVLDDGSGIDGAALRQRAAEAGFALDRDSDLHSLVFHPGLSSREAVDSSSGRGIGTAAVLDAVHRYGGTIDVDSTLGVGSRFSLKLPLTVAVAEMLIVETAGESYALPISSVAETVAAPAADLTRSGGELFLDRSGFRIPIVDLATFFAASAPPTAGGYAVILSSEGKLRGLLVERLSGLAEVVVTPLDAAFGRPPGIAGTTVTGSGDVMLILDPPALAASPAGVAA